MLNTKEISQKIKNKAKDLGFDLVGITRAAPASHFPLFTSWLEKGYAGQMSYLERGTEKRKDPDLILKGVKSIISCAINYYTETPPEQNEKSHGKIASYAWGKDYHKIVLEKLEALEKFILTEINPQAQNKSYVDTGAILEKNYAQEAGLGWIGKNTCLIHPKIGSWLFIGEVLTDLELAYDTPFATDHCGTCTRCLDACPTQAFTAPRILDARSCISYLTIEHRGEIPLEKREMMGSHISGCDICQDVCPYNHQPIPTTIKDFYPKTEFQENGSGNISLEKISKITPEEFQKLFFDSPIKRLKYEGLMRNAIIAMGNSGNPSFVETLKIMKSKIQNPMLEEHMEWAQVKLASKGKE